MCRSVLRKINAVHSFVSVGDIRRTRPLGRTESYRISKRKRNFRNPSSERGSSVTEKGQIIFERNTREIIKSGWRQQ